MRQPVSVAVCLLLAALWATSAVAAGAVGLQQVRDIAAAGANHLALKLIDQGQASLSPKQAAWARWERERLRVLASEHQWSALLRRVDAIPDSAPADLRRWARTQSAHALLETGKLERARQVLRELLWHNPRAPSAMLARWRRDVIRSYLDAGDYADAAIAIRHYRSDRGLGQPQLRRWQARVLLHAGKAAAAVKLLAGLGDPRSALLRLRAGLETGTPDPAVIAQRSRKIAAQAADDPLLGRDAWRLAAMAAARAGHPDAALRATEQAVAVAPRDARPDPLFAPVGDLWNLLAKRGEALGNARQLVIGDDPAWFKLGAALAKKSPVQAESVYAVIATQSPDAHSRERANTRLIRLFAQQPDGGLVLQSLYLASDHAGTLQSVPPEGRSLLAEQMIAIGDLPDASRLMRHLSQAPPGAGKLDWQLRRARVLILAGHPDAGARVLTAVLHAHATLDPKSIDHLVQVLFDLQAAKRDQEAVRLFSALLGKGVSPQQHREILFWMGDSEKALGHDLRAARDYLLSATLENPQAMDDWAQTARYHAAQELARAGDLADSARVYRNLLAATSDPSRTALLRTALYRVEARLSVAADGKPAR